MPQRAAHPLTTLWQPNPAAPKKLDGVGQVQAGDVVGQRQQRLVAERPGSSREPLHPRHPKIAVAASQVAPPNEVPREVVERQPDGLDVALAAAAAFVAVV
jgi:hypothetical protein